VTSQRALRQLAESTAEAVAGVLATLAPDGVERGELTMPAADSDPFAGIQTPAVAASVLYVDGVTASNVFVVTVDAARRFAASMLATEPTEDGGELSDLELSAVSEAMELSLAAAAGATSRLLGGEIEIAAPQTRVLATPADAEDLYEKTAYATVVSFSIFGEPCRFVQLFPNAFVVRLAKALGELTGELLAAPASATAGLRSDVLRDVELRVWAELGRARLPVGRAVGLAPGSILELDRAADDPVDLYVNGRRFAWGRLLLADDGEWVVRIEDIATANAISDTETGVT
jgi:flagellar motor switch protein FliN/FliY